MDYRNIFESSINEARSIARLPDDDRFIRIVKERASNMEKKKIKMKRLAVIAASIAAAAALTVSVGALVNYFHQQSVDIFFPDASGTETASLIEEDSPLTSANEHFRITLDKTYFDGDNLTCIMTAESLDGTPMTVPDIQACHDGQFTAGSYPLHYDMSGGEFRSLDLVRGTETPFVAHISEYELKRMGVAGGFETLAGETYIRFGKYLGEGIFDGIELRVNVEKNVDAAEVFSEDGDKLIMTQIGFYSDEISVLPKMSEIKSGEPHEFPKIKLIRNDGTFKEFKEGDYPYSMWSDTWCYILLPEYIQLDDYTGIEVNGVRYLKNN